MVYRFKQGFIAGLPSRPQRRIRPSRRQRCFAAAALTACLWVPCAVRAQPPAGTAQQDMQQQSVPRTILPPRAGLLPLPLPNLGTLEEKVGSQIAELQDAFFERISRPEGLSDGDLAETYGSLGQLYQAYELHSPAEAAYLNAYRLDAKNFQWTYLLGTLYQKSGRLQEAQLYLQNARQMRPDYLAAAVHLGNIHLQMNQPAQARLQFEAALQLDANSAAAHFGLGEAELAEQRYEGALQHFQAALEQVPEANRIHYSLAMAYRGLGDLEKARTHLQQRGTVGVRPADPLLDELQSLLQGERVHILRGRLAYQAGMIEQAAQAFRQAVQAAPQSQAARVNLGSALGRLGEIDGAIEQYRTALKLHPGNATAHYNLGALLMGKGKALEALVHFQEALKINPEDAEANLQVAKLLLRAGSLEAALPLASKARSLNPDDEEGVIVTADILVRQGQYREAFSVLDESYAVFPRRARTVHALARLLAASPDIAIRNGEQALKLALAVYNVEKTVSHARTVAYALAETGRCEEAAEWQRKMIAVLDEKGERQMAADLQSDLARYQNGPPCRPPDLEGLTPPASARPDQGEGQRN